MSRETIRTIYSADRQSRVSIFRRNDGTYGFCEERFSGEPGENCWSPTARHTESFCPCEEIVLRESIGRVPWLAEMVACSEDIDGLPRRKATGAPPSLLGGATVLCYTPIDQRHRFTGACKQIVRGELMGPMAGLAICQYAGEEAFYLFGCDSDWQDVTDTWHQTLQEAQQQAEFEYEGVSKTWVFAEAGAAPNGGPAGVLTRRSDEHQEETIYKQVTCERDVTVPSKKVTRLRLLSFVKLSVCLGFSFGVVLGLGLFAYSFTGGLDFELTRHTPYIGGFSAEGYEAGLLVLLACPLYYSLAFGVLAFPAYVPFSLCLRLVKGISIADGEPVERTQEDDCANSGEETT